MKTVIIKKKSASCGCDERSVNSGAGNCCSGSEKNSCSCNSTNIDMIYSYNMPWIEGIVDTPAGKVQRVSTKLSFSDRLGGCKARWGINRMHYTVNPGIYCIGQPDSNSPVLVTANYKLTFDSLRRELTGLDAWIVVLDTKGINVWCAAGKGTFGTKELIFRLAKVKLASIVNHRNIILPQLGAPGIIAHEVLKHSGFKVTFGPVRACDLKKFIENGMQADSEMRTVRFTFRDRLVLTPIETVYSVKKALPVLGVLFIFNCLGISHFALFDLIAITGAILAGTFLTPVLLPYIPGRAFSFKGLILGLIWWFGINYFNGWPASVSSGLLLCIAYFLILPSISSYLAMNFTGCSTYTSFSGVKREMQLAIPIMVVSVSLGIVLVLVNTIINL